MIVSAPTPSSYPDRACDVAIGDTLFVPECDEPLMRMRGDGRAAVMLCCNLATGEVVELPLQHRACARALKAIEVYQ